ncbi:MAG: RecX family transcriptional regulator [Prevotella sp.]|nr:RecX family transcriptional regulator [Prevotella sp.]
MSEKEVLLKLTALCARGEHCQHDMLEKMSRWGVDNAIQASVMAYLTDHHYVDDERYARAYVNDKIKYNHWGRRKVEQGLWQKHIDPSLQQRVLDDIDDSLYVEILRPLLQQKRRTTRADSDYELNQKLMKFALSRGFTYDIIRQCIDTPETD